MKKQLLSLAVLLTSFGSMAQIYFQDDFEGGTLTANNAWTSEVVVDTDATGSVWVLGTVGGNYAKMTNFIASANHELDVWFISPSINLLTATSPLMSFDMTKRYAGDDIVVQISTDYITGAPSTGTWTDITSLFTLDANTGVWTFVPSGNGDISAYTGANVHIAFEYLGTAVDGSTWEIDNVMITEGILPIPDVSIYDIQNTGAYTNDSVNTGGIVTGVFDSFGNKGYFLQAGVGAWTGIYVADTVNIPTRGDSLTVTGVVKEVFGNTQLENISNFAIVNSGNSEPASVNVSTLNANMEDYEGVKITVNNATCVDPNLGFGEWAVNDGSDSVRVHDLMYTYSPVLNEIYQITGPMYYAYGYAKIEPRDAADILVAVGIGELSNEKLTVYPNPSTGLINVNNKGEEIRVYNTVGELISTTSEGSLRLETGVYVIKVGNATKRVIVL